MPWPEVLPRIGKMREQWIAERELVDDVDARACSEAEEADVRKYDE